MKRLIITLYYLVFTFFFVGAMLHRSFTPQLYHYSYKYAFLLLILSSGIFLPLIIRLLAAKYGAKAVTFTALPTLLLIVISYCLASFWYYYTQEHLFDPFLQMPPPPLNEQQLIKPPGTFRILFLGGSTTRNDALPPEKRFPHIVESLLQNHYQNVEIEIFNGGMDWYTAKHSLINYVTSLRDWQPDLVVVMHAINDLYRSFSPSNYAVGPYNRLWTHYYGPAINGARPPTFEQVLLGRTFFSLYSQIREKSVDYPLKRYYSLNDYQRNFEVLVDYLQKDDLAVILMTQPSLYKDSNTAEELARMKFGKVLCYTKKNFFRRDYPSANSLKTAMAAFNESTRDIALQGGVMLVDLEATLSKEKQNFLDDVHYTESASELIAQLISRRIIAENLIID